MKTINLEIELTCLNTKYHTIYQNQTQDKILEKFTWYTVKD